MTDEFVPKFIAAQGILTPPLPTMGDAGRDKAFIAKAGEAFPSMVHRTLASEVPPNAPYLVMASTSSRLAVSAAQADFQVRFYGDYEDDLARGLDYVERKLRTVLEAYGAVDTTVSSVGIVLTAHYSWKDRPGPSPVEHLREKHLRTDVPDDSVQDAFVRLALRSQDTYYVNITLSNFESRMVDRPMIPGMNFMRVRPWEGKVDDFGIELAVDVNNNLQARVSGEEPVLTAEDLSRIVGVVRETVEMSSSSYIPNGTIPAVPGVTRQAEGV
jgi:hypothetical protein